jgi:hypothetical protein
MEDLRRELEAAFPLAPIPTEPIVAGRDDDGLAAFFGGHAWRGHDADELRRRPKALMQLSGAGFRYYLPAFIMASIEDGAEHDMLPAMIVGAIASRAADAKALTPAQRKVVARFLATHVDDADLRGGKLLAALGNLSQ